MSVSAQFTQPQQQQPQQQQQHQQQKGSAKRIDDCRDYLRTGRCKYGASCKYFHPPNVQSGGGMKAPLDPTEPMFPIRPSEPTCQYYMKHGMCKFGQACKFNHPPQSIPSIINGGSGGQTTTATVLMNVGRIDEGAQLVLNAVATQDHHGGSPMMLQLLPQRPDEPDCIYFLKNGRCKYGATCRYHHPINFHQQRTRMDEQRRHVEPRRSGVQSERFQAQPVQYIAHPVASYPPSQAQIFVHDGNQMAFQPIQIVQGSDGNPNYCIPIGSTLATEQESSGSSIASSFDTAVSNHDALGPHSEVTALWNAVKRNGSGGSLNTSDTRTQRILLPHSASDGNIASRRLRASSYGSSSDNAYTEAGNVTPTRSSSARNLPYDPTRRALPNHQYTSRNDVTEMHNSSDGRSTMRIRPVVGFVPGQTGPRGHPHARSPRGEGDEGFTMMTSALLNMLDTPEEASGESFSDDDPHQAAVYRYASSFPSGTLENGVDHSLMERLSLNQTPDYRSNHYNHYHQELLPPSRDEWPPAHWNGSSSSIYAATMIPDVRASTVATHARMNPRRPQPHSTSPLEPEVGLYLS